MSLCQAYNISVLHSYLNWLSILASRPALIPEAVSPYWLAVTYAMMGRRPGLPPMRRLNPTLSSAELTLVTDDIRQLFEDLERAGGSSGEYSTGEYTPPLDVYETDRTVEVRMDVPGVRADSLRVVFKHGVLIIVGAKAPAGNVSPGSATFHLVEREFGRFARAVRLTAAVDVAQARARLLEGELWVSVPKIAERRGHEIQITIEVDRRAPGASR